MSDRLGNRLGPLRTIGVALAIFTAAVAAAVDAPLAVAVPLFVVAGVLSMSWNGLAYAAAAEAAGAARTGAALGFQQTLLGVVVAGAPPLVALVATHSWRLAFFLAALGPAAGVLILQRLREPARGRRPARTRGTSASLPAAPRTPD
jgi:MFS family permease